MLTEIKKLSKSFFNLLKTEVYFFTTDNKLLKNNRTLVLFPVEYSNINCGLSGIITFKNISGNSRNAAEIISEINSAFDELKHKDFLFVEKNQKTSKDYLGGEQQCKNILTSARKLKLNQIFSELFFKPELIDKTKNIAAEMDIFCKSESEQIDKKLGILPPEEGIKTAELLEVLKDAAWTIQKEILENIEKINQLSQNKVENVSFYRKLNTVLNSINILEVRGRDSAGISVFTTFTEKNYSNFIEKLKNNSLEDIFSHRKNIKELTNYKISINKNPDNNEYTVIFTYKFAAETGALGDNIRFIRNQIKNDLILNAVSESNPLTVSAGAHTRWASVGEISQLNCHPVDNSTFDKTKHNGTSIHVSLNGDIDNYHELKSDFENKIDKIPEKISTDTKIIPLQISKFYNDGYSIEEAFRLAVSEFKGSHAILMQTGLAPGKMFLAQKGSGQAVFVGISEDSYTVASEVYGFVERTQDYYKLEGEKNNGQIVILDENQNDKIKGISSFTYNGEKINIDENMIQTTPITSRDVDRQNFEHFFLKEIFESPSSARKTLQGRWEITDKTNNIKKPAFDNFIFPEKIRNEFLNNKIKRIFFIGQGTAGVAANAGAFIAAHYLGETQIQISSLKASELSGFVLDESGSNSMENALVVAITQSGTTTDTNKSIDMAKNCGAKTMAIVNRRDSDITFKVDGVLYTSTGRDIEMSVASTKAFYAQVTAGALLGLFLADLLKTKTANYISDEIDRLTRLPQLMEKILDNKDEIKLGAQKTAHKKTYWATVGSGPNKAAADEIRIKLSELCYRTISSDYVEDKKHIDLSSEPLILVCAAGARESVMSDIIKDTAIFKAHKSETVVFANENDKRFDTDSDVLIKIPDTGEHLTPLLVTLAGHLWGYYAAREINKDSVFFYNHRKNIEEAITSLQSENKELFEIILEKEFKVTIASFYRELRKHQHNENFFSILPPNFTSDLVLLLNYLYGRLNASDFELDFSVKGTPSNMISKLFEMLSLASDLLSRPIDAIKHQAKTVTVGTSRISEKPEGIVFDFLNKSDIELNQVTPQNLVVIKNIQEVINSIKGSVLYKIDDLNMLGEPAENTKISVVTKDGSLKAVPSRAESDTRLKGTKKIIVREGNVFIGKGQKDGRPLLVIPVTSKEGAENHQRIEYLLSLEIEFKTEIPLYIRVKALGGKLERIKNNIQENNITWNNSLLDLLKPEDLFGLSYEKIVEKIMEKI
ncbi:MAG: SIS domain-containing protein [Thermodesulfobacteriota bacterium]